MFPTSVYLILLCGVAVVKCGYIKHVFRDAKQLVPHHGKEGKDYFFDEAIGRNITCSEFCDLPTAYPITCKDKCREHTPKNRTSPTTGESTPGLAQDHGKEGKDYFFDDATGRNITCSEFCDLPTAYHTTCKDKCRDYTPKNRVAATTTTDESRPGLIEQEQDKIVPIVVTGVCIVVIVLAAFVIVKCFGEKLEKYFRIRIFRENLTKAVPEQGNPELSEPGVTLVQTQTTPADIGTGQEPQVTDSLV